MAVALQHVADLNWSFMKKTCLFAFLYKDSYIYIYIHVYFLYFFIIFIVFYISLLFCDIGHKKQLRKIISLNEFQKQILYNS